MLRRDALQVIFKPLRGVNEKFVRKVKKESVFLKLRLTLYFSYAIISAVSGKRPDRCLRCLRFSAM